MKGPRIGLLVLLLVSAAAATCSILFPQFRMTTDDTIESKNTVYFWYRETSTSLSFTSSVTIQRVYSSALTCLEGKLYFTVMEALSVCAASLLGAAAFFTACWINARNGGGLSVIVTFLSMCSFACCGATVGLIVYVYKTTLCPNSSSMMMAPEADGYAYAEGFYLLCATTGTAFICSLFVFVLCCTSICCGRGYDKDY